MRWIHGISETINRIVELSLFGLGFSMAMITGAQVFCRYVLNHSLFWSEEMGRILLVWITFLGATAAYKRKAHVGIDIIVRRLPEVGRKVVEGFVISVSMAFFWVMVFYGIVFIRFVADQKTAALGIPMALCYAVLPLSGSIFTVHAVSQILDLYSTRQG